MRIVIWLWLFIGAALAGCSTAPGGSQRAEMTAADQSLVLVFGASGRSGRYIIRELEAQDRAFRAVTSNTARARENVGDQYDWVEADVRDPESLPGIFSGVTHVISSLGATEFKGPNGPEFVDYLGVKNVVDASLAQGVEQLVLISASGVTNPDHPLNKLGDVMVWKLKGEDYVRASGLPYTIIRPGGLLDRDAGEFKMVFRQGDTLPYNDPLSVTTRDDLAKLCIAALDDPDARFKTFEAFNDRSQPGGKRTASFAELSRD